MMNIGPQSFFEFFEDADHPTTFQGDNADLSLAVQNSEAVSHDLSLAIQETATVDADFALPISASESTDFDLALTIQAVSLLGLLIGIRETATYKDHDLTLQIEAAGVTVDASILLSIRNDERMIN